MTSMPTAPRILSPSVADAPALLGRIAEACRREAEARKGDEVHQTTPGGILYVVVPSDRFAEAASILDDTAGDLRGTLALVGAEPDDWMASAEFADGEAAASYLPTQAELDDLELVRCAHDLVRLAGDRLPASLRQRLVAWSGLVLDGTSRPAVTPAGASALSAATV
jgi:hypothetical protein